MQEDINVTVVYPAARKPFDQHHAPPTQTLGTLKPLVLDAFGLEETTAPDGSTTAYTFYHGKEALTDLSRTLGSIAGNAHALTLKLSQQITQGGS
jgi:hypothetical protein